MIEFRLETGNPQGRGRFSVGRDGVVYSAWAINIESSMPFTSINLGAVHVEAFKIRYGGWGEG
jgi:hypothetical protein